MLEPYVNDYEKYLEFAFRISGCNHLKYDMVNDMFIRLDEVLNECPGKKISDGYIYVIMKYSYLNLVSRKKEYPTDTSTFMLAEEDDETLCERQRISETLSRLSFKDREILLKCQEESFREVGRKLGMHHTTVSKIYSQSMEKLKSQIR